MNIEKKTEGSTVTLVLDGWMNTQSVPEFIGALDGIGPDAENLVLDLTSLQFISSSGISRIIAAHKKMNGKLTLVHVSAEVLEVLHLTGLDKRLNITE